MDCSLCEYRRQYILFLEDTILKLKIGLEFYAFPEMRKLRPFMEYQSHHEEYGFIYKGFPAIESLKQYGLTANLILKEVSQSTFKESELTEEDY